jgi:hypothetical protein
LLEVDEVSAMVMNFVMYLYLAPGINAFNEALKIIGNLVESPEPQNLGTNNPTALPAVGFVCANVELKHKERNSK